MVDIKHIQQINDGFNWKCGAVCLEMIFNYYGISCNQNDIWEAVKTNRPTGIGQKYALTYSLAQYAIDRGLNCTIYKAGKDSWSDVLNSLDQRNIPAILCVKEKKSGQSHFMIYIGRKNGKLMFSDPNSSRETVAYDYLELRDMWSPHPEINVTGFIYLIFDGNSTTHTCSLCNREYPVLEHENGPVSELTICPYCDKLN